MTVSDSAMPNVVSAFVSVSGLSRSYAQGQRSQQVLQDATFALGRGETVALLGRSGSGKSTLLNLLSGIDLPDAGRVQVNGVEVTGLQEPASTLFRRRHVGFIYQFFNLIPGLTAAENVALSLELNDCKSAEALQRTLQLLDSIGMSALAEKFPTQLSGGEQQRIAIARALIHSPALVLADEPTGNLDAETGRHILGWMREQLRAQGSTCLLVTHSLAVARTADRILTLEDGRITERSGEFAW
jgi:putative ABC transport system ATP-binding protein